VSRIRAGISLALGVLLTLCLFVPSAGAHSKNLVSNLAQGHRWRHGVVPQRGSKAASFFSSGGNLSYGGGISGVGVATGPPKVYLVFWGSQWGTQSTNTAGNYTYGGDPKSMAPDLQAFFKGLGTGGEKWSGVMTQYCQGVAVGTQTCPTSSTQHVGYPTGGALGGVWEDTSSAAPSQATAHELAAEAVNAANHFGDFSPNAEYFIVSPTGTNPDGWLTGGFCAWHDYSGDNSMDGGGAVSSPNGPVAFTNMPYVTDAGTSCGENFVNSGSAGTLDGVTIVGGHEYAETITDTFPAGGWTDNSGYETGDKCAWISGTGQAASQNITLTTGTFAVQSTWANDYSACRVSDQIITNSPPVTVNSVANQTNMAGDNVSLQMGATEPNGTSSCGICTFTATGLPSGVSISSSGLISGQVTKAGTSSVTVTATDPDGVDPPGSTTFSWSVKAGTVTAITVSPSNPTVSIGSTEPFTASGKDAFGNAADVSQATWTVTPTGTPPGSVTPGPSSSATFTPTTPGSGTVAATVGTVTGSTGVTVIAAPPNAIANGGFESGTFADWTPSGAAENVVSSASYFCHSGSYCAQLGLPTPTNGNSNIAQTFTAPSGTSTVSFYYDVVCTDTVRYDWATATLRDVTLGKTYTILPKTCSNTGAWSKVSHSVTPGHHYTLTLTNRDDNYPGDPTYTLYDDVSVQ
jgi:hypothetical protein